MSDSSVTVLSAATLQRKFTNTACWYLERYPANTAKLRANLYRRAQKLQAQGYQLPDDWPAVVAVVLQTLHQQGVLNDAQYAADKAAALQRKGLPASTIAMRLRALGVKEADIATCTAQAPDTMVAACQFIRKQRLGAFAIREISIDKALGKLARAGFSYGVARAVLAMSEAEVDVMVAEGQ